LSSPYAAKLFTSLGLSVKRKLTAGWSNISFGWKCFKLWSVWCESQNTLSIFFHLHAYNIACYCEWPHETVCTITTSRWHPYMFTVCRYRPTVSADFNPLTTARDLRVLNTWSDNKVREHIAVKVLHTLLLNITVVSFKVLPLRSYAPMQAPSPPFETILELVLWNALQSCRRITPDVINVIKMPYFQYFFYLREQKKSSGEHGGCSSTVICLLSKTTSQTVPCDQVLWDHFC
jgi:hypothetical protein